MDRETLNYIADRMRTRRSEQDGRNTRRMEDTRYTEHSNYEEHPISSRYGGYSTNTYRAEGTIEGHIEHDPYKKEREIGFRIGNKKDKTDLLYELEEAFEDMIDCIMYYSELAMEAHTKGKIEFADAFYDIAKSKLSCAESLHHRLISHGTYDPSKQSEIEDRFDKAKHLFRRL